MSRGWIGYDWFKLVVAIILALLLLLWGTQGGGAPATAVVPTAAATAVVPTATAPQIAAPALDALSGLAAGPVTLTGTGAPGSQVEVMVDGKSVGKATVGTDGKWSLLTDLAEGAHQVVVNAIDSTGKVLASAAAVALNIAGPKIALPTFNLPSGLTAGKTTLTGTGTPGSQVEVMVDGKSVGKATVGADGKWSLPVDLAEGAHTVLVNAIDAAGKILASAPEISLNVGAAPVTAAAPTLKLPDPLTAGNVMLSGTGTPGSQVEVMVDGKSVGKATVGADGTWSFPVDLAEGKHELVVNAIDASGKVLASSAPVTATVAAAAGQPVAAAAPTLKLPDPLTAGNVTLTGTGTPGSQVEVMLDGKSVGKATVGADGTWSLPVDLTEGSYEIVANAIDADGKVLASSAPVTATVGAAAAAVTPKITSPADGATIPAAPFTMTGTGAPGSQLDILDGDKVIGTVTVGADGTWKLDVTPTPGTAAYDIRPAGAANTLGTPIRVTIGQAAATCTTLAVNCNAWVTREGGKRLRLRDAAGLQGGVLDMLPPGTQMTLLEGPQQRDGYNWWRIRTTGGKEGWVAGEELRLQPD